MIAWPTERSVPLGSTPVSLVVVGCNHRSTPLEVLERLAVAPEDLPKALHEAASADNLSEAVVLSTCGRVEVYSYAERFHGGYADIRELLARHSGLPPEVVADELYAYHDTDTVRHLFNVAAGLDSVVLGEHEILGQIKTAWLTARSEGTVGNALEPLFRHAVEAGKRARTATCISRGVASLSHAAVALAAERLGSLRERRILVLGAGDMGTGMLKSLAGSSPAEIVVASRTRARAEAAAATCSGQAVSLDALHERLVNADVLFATTGASNIIVEHADLDAVMSQRNQAPLLIIDIAVPRDVDPTAGELRGITLLNMDDVGAFVEQGRMKRSREADAAKAIVEEELERFQAFTSAREVAPLIAALRVRADCICAHEIERHEPRLRGLTPDQRAAVESLLHGTVNKLLHEPTVRLKDASGHARGNRLAEALRDLFDL